MSQLQALKTLEANKNEWMSTAHLNEHLDISISSITNNMARLRLAKMVRWRRIGQGYEYRHKNDIKED